MVRVSGQANMQAKWSHAKRIAYKQPCSCCCPSCGGRSSSNRGDAILSVARLRRLLPLPSSCSSTRCQVPESHTLNRPGAGVMALFLRPAAAAEVATCRWWPCSGQPGQDAGCWQHLGALPDMQLTKLGLPCSLAAQPAATPAHRLNNAAARGSAFQQVCTTSIVVPADQLQQEGTPSTAPCELT